MTRAMEMSIPFPSLEDAMSVSPALQRGLNKNYLKKRKKIPLSFIKEIYKTKLIHFFPWFNICVNSVIIRRNFVVDLLLIEYMWCAIRTKIYGGRQKDRQTESFKRGISAQKKKH